MASLRMSTTIARMMGSKSIARCSGIEVSMSASVATQRDHVR